MKVGRFFAKYLWLWFLLLLVAGVLFFTFTGNDPILPAVYR